MKKLMRILDVNDVFTDGFVLNEEGTIAFLSVVGKDTAIQEFRARWSLPVTQGGLKDFQVETSEGTVRLVLGDPESLEFLSGRLNTQLFGELIQVFIHKKLALKPDFVNRKALQLFNKSECSEVDLQNRLWVLIKNLSPLPLLDEWQKVIVSLFLKKGWLKELPGMGDVNANTISVPEDELAALLKANIRSGALLAKANDAGKFTVTEKITVNISEPFDDDIDTVSDFMKSNES